MFSSTMLVLRPPPTTLRSLRKTLSTNSSPHRPPHPPNNTSWSIHSYKSSKEETTNLQLTPSLSPPLLRSPTDLLILVHSSSVNPLDVEMAKGYGSSTINLLRDAFDPSSLHEKLPKLLKQTVLGQRSHLQQSIEFPLTLGRDFSGTVVDLGHGVREKNSQLQIGSEVFGVVGVQRQGTHALYVVADSETVREIFMKVKGHLEVS
jgi:NADPH:quinone reductase-like Zn-dependent oxidoreductase